MRIISPVPTGSGAFVVHKSLETGIDDYRVIPYHRFWALLPPAIACFRDRSADLVHAPVDYAVFSKLEHKPLVSTFHGFVLDSYIYKYVSMLQRAHYRLDLKMFIKKAMRVSSMITCVSRYLSGLVRDELAYTGPIRVIYNGVDTRLLYPVKRPDLPRGEFRVLYCGGPGRRKGSDLIPEILEKVSPGTRLVYTSGTKSGVDFIRHPAALCVGPVRHEAMPALYNDVDVLLAPSVREGFGLAVAEAMACGLPVIATNCSSMPELVDDGSGGFLCTLGDAGMFADRINRLAQSPGLRNQMGEYNRSKVERMFTAERMVKEYRELFEEVLSVN